MPLSASLVTYKELKGRTLKDISGDGKLILVGSGSNSGWELEVVERENGRVIAQLMGPMGRKLPGGAFVGFLPPFDYAFVEDFVFNKSGSERSTVWDFRKNTLIDCGNGTQLNSASADLRHTVAGIMIGLEYSRNTCAVRRALQASFVFPDTVSPDRRNYLTLGPRPLEPYTEVEVRDAANFEIVGRINSGAELFEDDRFGNPPRYTADGKLIFAVVVDNQKTPRWYLRIYKSNTLRFQAQIDVTEWNPRINRIATAKDSLTTPPHFGPTLVVAPNGQVAAIGNVDNSLRIFDLPSKREIANAPSARPPYFFTTDGTSLITDGGAGMRIWSLAETQ